MQNVQIRFAHQLKKKAGRKNEETFKFQISLDQTVQSIQYVMHSSTNSTVQDTNVCFGKQNGPGSLCDFPYYDACVPIAICVGTTLPKSSPVFVFPTVLSKSHIVLKAGPNT